MPKYDLKGRNVLITGASSGIGRGLSRCFAAEGGNLALGCHPSDKAVLESWCAELAGKYGVKVSGFPIDLAEPGGPERMYDSAKSALGKVDVLVNNAGILHYGHFADIPITDHEALIAVNVTAYLKLMRLCLPDMVKAGGGRILNVVSTAAFQPTPWHAAYGASKAFMQSLSEAVNGELRGTGVKVLTFNPSYTRTPLLARGGFPPRVWWFRISGLSDPEDMARKAVKAFKKEKPLHIPLVRNWLVHSILIRAAPRGLINRLSTLVLREER
ncbi:MAG: SDR family oxidoreductase [Dehalococcoidia bacterium]|nr:SDR family oxidoreductase [Dehalococcoidia bacterium]